VTNRKYGDKGNVTNGKHGDTKNLTNRKYQDAGRVTGPARGPFASIPCEGFRKSTTGHHEIAFGTSL